VESGPLPESCFEDPGADDCRSGLAAAEQAFGLPGLSDGFAQGVLPLCFQLGSMLEGGSAQGDCYPSGLVERAQLESFVLAFDTNLKPMVGQQLTLTDSSYDDPRLVPLLVAAGRGDCDLSLQQRAEGFLLTRPSPHDPGSSLLLDASGRTLPLWQIAGHPGALTWTCHPPAPERAEARRAAFWRGLR
jgi:hypothetical protein